MIFDLPVFLNPGTWAEAPALLPNLIFIGAAFFSILYRWARAEPAQRGRLRKFVLGGSLLMILYFSMYLFDDVYPTLSGQTPLATMQAVVIYVLVSEPLWFVAELIFAIASSQAILRDGLLEG